MNVTSIRNILATLVLASASLSPATQAQSGPLATSIKVSIPFPFEYGAHVLPAGTYEITNQGQTIVRLTNGTDCGLVMVQTDSSPYEAKNSELVFHKVGGAYFLREILTAGRREHVALTESKGEKKARAVQAASNHGPAELFEIAVVHAGN